MGLGEWDTRGKLTYPTIQEQGWKEDPIGREKARGRA